MITTTNRDGYLLDVLDVFGPNAVRLVAKRLADEHAGDVANSAYGGAEYARNVVAGYVVDLEQLALAECDPDMWDGVTTEEAHEIRASVIRDVADALVDIASERADDAYEARMSCSRRRNDCGCRACGG
jgi:hypothetical protein